MAEKELQVSCPWLQHAHSAAAILISTWPRSQVLNDQKRALLDVSYTSVRCMDFKLSLVFVLIAFCFQSLASLIGGKPVPQMFVPLAKNCEPVGGYPASNDPSFLWICLCFTMSSLINLYLTTTPSSQYLQTELYASAIARDQDLESWVISLPSMWAYQTSGDEPHHIYGSPWFARTWNCYRLSRLLANKIILDGLNAHSLSLQATEPNLFDTYKSQENRSASLISELSKDICISLPAMFDLSRRRPASIPLSLDVFFVVTILQSLNVLTGGSSPRHANSQRRRLLS